MKAILLVRVSTDNQDFDEQEREVYQMAIKDGYKSNDIIPICEKESGRKLTEEERAGLNKMKELIESDSSINCVYCWEVSRIARRKKINFSVLDYLAEHKVQLIIKEPYIRLLKDNGEIDDAAETIFTLFSQLAESEMRTKLARWKRTKDARRKESYYTGGKISFGYKVENGKIVPDEVNSLIVKEIFNKYATGNYSYNTLAKYYMETGVLKHSFATSRKFIATMLKGLHYTGEPTSKSIYGYKRTTEGNVYPAIISKELFNKCAEVALKNTVAPKKETKHIFYAKGILRCPYCGNTFAAKSNGTYECIHCLEGFSIQINLVDSVLWYNAIALYALQMKHDNKEQKAELVRQINELEAKITTATNTVNSIGNRIEQIEHRAFVEGTLDINKADAFIKELNAKADLEDKNISKWMDEKELKEQLLIEINSEKKYTTETLVAIKDDQVRNEIIHKVYDRVIVEKLPEPHTFRLAIYSKFIPVPTIYILDTLKKKVYNEEGEEEMAGCYENRYTKPVNKAKMRAYNVKYCATHKEENARRQREWRARKKAEKLQNQ